ncbi:hypothetical protein [Rosenbergiella collisarenosi]|uniref:hypothetical protein n=1 Tax=Rosenbergiella collisarenosi TaxID=1544695 RepID=UPI001F4E0248|nr:hypothetical protein [Rosenbergiella collisarenosi]
MSQKDSFKGSTYTVTHCKNAKKSLAEALLSVKADKRSKMLNSINLQLQRLADGKRSPDISSRMEGQLPSYQGKPKKNFCAIKKNPVRCYYWESERFEMTYFVSHYIKKDFDKLSANDSERVCNNWDRIEGGTDDY